MTTIKAITGNIVKNNGGIALGLPSDGSNISALTHADNHHPSVYNHKAILAVSPTQSGNVGGIKALAGGVYNDQEDGKYVAKVIGSRIAQTDNTVLRGGNATIAGRNMLRYYRGDNRYDLDSYDYFTGTMTKGNNAGDSFDMEDGAGNVIGHEAFPTNAVPGEFTYRTGSLLPVNADYNPRNE